MLLASRSLNVLVVRLVRLAAMGPCRPTFFHLFPGASMIERTPHARHEPARYTLTAKILHWTCAALVVGMLGLGWYMTSVEDQPGSDQLFRLHQSIGGLFVLLIGFRVVWRATHRRSESPVTPVDWQARIAVATHLLLYVAMIVLPLLGIAGAMVSKSGLNLFGYALPRVLPVAHDMAELLFDAHGAIATALAAMVALHVAAAIKHVMVDKDGVFQRMWFGGPHQGE